MDGRDFVKITFKDSIGSQPINSEFPTSTTFFDLYEIVATNSRRKISKIVIQMSGPYMSTILEKSRDKTLKDISGAFEYDEKEGINIITLFVIYDIRGFGGSLRKRRKTNKKRRTNKKRKTNKKRRTNRRK